MKTITRSLWFGVALALTYAWPHPVTASSEPKSVLGERQYIAGVDYPSGSSQTEDGAGCPDWRTLRDIWRGDCRDDPWMCQETIQGIYRRAEENIRRDALALAKAAHRPGGKVVLVRKGDSFSSLFGSDWRRIADLNGYETSMKLVSAGRWRVFDYTGHEASLRLQEDDVLFVPPSGWKPAADSTSHSALHAAN